MMNDSARHDHIFVLTGPVQGGKTTVLTEKIGLLREKGVKILGFLCPGSFSEGKRSAFSLVDIETGRQVPMGDANEQKGWEKFRRFYFNPEAFVQGKLWIKRDLEREPDLLVIEEVLKKWSIPEIQAYTAESIDNLTQRWMP